MRSLLRYSIAPLFLIGPVVLGTLACGGEDGGPGPVPEECNLDVQDESDPAFPDGFDYNGFINTIQPILVAKCTVGACHEVNTLHPLTAGVAEGKYAIFTIWQDAKADAPAGSTEACDLVQNFNHFIHQTDYNTPANSVLLQKAVASVAHTGGQPLLPDSAEYTTILNFLEAAKTKRGGPVVTGPPNGQYFDRAAFDTIINASLDSNGCSGAGTCHGTAGSAGNNLFPLINAAADTASLDANFAAVVGKINLETTIDSTVYYQATTAHLGSVVMKQADADALLDWIQDAAEAKCNIREG
ncbi:MAG TPA: hypothetical protein VFG83_13480, partial [Kofleriaceae bacterium]|nr:hypothetical protein [Kofleriaceae bacterium]